MSLFNKIGGLVVICVTIGGMVLAWQNYRTAPEISLLILSCLCVLAVAGTMVALSLVTRARQDTAKLSLLFENAIDRLEQRHDGDHARLVMTLAALDLRSSNRLTNSDLTKETLRINDMAPLQSAMIVKKAARANRASSSKKNGEYNALTGTAHDERPFADAVNSKKLSLSLQPIFEMPSAQVRGYLAFAQVGGHNIRRLKTGSIVNLGEFEYQLLFAAAKAARQILANVPGKSQLFCSIGHAALRETKSLDAIIQLFEAQRVLKETLVLLIASEGLRDVSSAVFDRLKRAGILLSVEGMPDSVDILRHCKGSYWFVNADDIIALPMTEYAQQYRHNAEINKLTLVALEGGTEAELVELIDLNVALVTSQYLSPPRLVRDANIST